MEDINSVGGSPTEGLSGSRRVYLELPLQSFEKKYQIVSNLGKGSFGSVFLAKNRGNDELLLEPTAYKKDTLMDPLLDRQYIKNSLVAIKTMTKRLASLEDYSSVKEVLFILSVPSHPNLMQVYEVFIDDVHFQLHIAMECMNQNLYQLIKSRRHNPFSSVTLRSILSQLLNGIRHIHRYSYFHRDIKPENILVIPAPIFYGEKLLVPYRRRNDNYIIKLADYGLARHINNTKQYTAYVSTRWYRAPEILLRKRSYSKPVDVWAFGSVAVEVATFSPLFPGENELDQTWRILETLGSPSREKTLNGLNELNIEVPLGGYWDEAQSLAAKLGFHLPFEKGIRIEKLLPRPEHTKLAEVVKACLVWDPDSRADVEYLCSLPYFKDSVVAQPYCEPDRLLSWAGNLGLKGSKKAEDAKEIAKSLCETCHRDIPIKDTINKPIQPSHVCTFNHKSGPQQSAINKQDIPNSFIKARDNKKVNENQSHFESKELKQRRVNFEFPEVSELSSSSDSQHVYLQVKPAPHVEPHVINVFPDKAIEDTDFEYVIQSDTYSFEQAGLNNENEGDFRLHDTPPELVKDTVVTNEDSSTRSDVDEAEWSSNGCHLLSLKEILEDPTAALEDFTSRIEMGTGVTEQAIFSCDEHDDNYMWTEQTFSKEYEELLFPTMI